MFWNKSPFVLKLNQTLTQWPEHDRKCRDTHLNWMCPFWYRISVILFWLTFEIGVADKESSEKFPLVEISRKGKVWADSDCNKRMYDVSELFCALQVRYINIGIKN